MNKNSDPTLKYLIWAYFLLIIFEGALRKWFLPGQSDMLLVVRDPILLLIYFLALSKGKFVFNGIVIGMLVLIPITTMTAISMGHGHIMVTAFGVRTNFLHVPLIFLMPKVFDRRDVIRFAKATMWITLLMTPLIAMQFLQPQSAWVNRGVGGDLSGAGFDGAEGRYRPPGTFSFISGLSMFYAFSTAMLMTLMSSKDAKASKLILAACSVAIVLAVPLSISRSLALSCAIVVVASVVFLGVSGFQIGRLVQASVFIGIAAVAVQFIPVFEEATSAFGSRWDAATTDKGGFSEAIVDRVLNDLTGPFVQALNQPIFGIGIGAGTNVGATYLTGGMGFLAGEGELFRIMGEMGPIFGVFYLILRWGILFQMIVTSLRAAKKKNPVPGIILGAGALWVFYGQWGPPTLQGFTIFTAGLCLTAARVPKSKKSKRATRSTSGKEPASDDEFQKLPPVDERSPFLPLRS